MVCTILTLAYAVKGQKTTPTPFSKPSTRTSNGIKDDPPADQEPACVPAPSPELDLWHQETMTGDWGGTRARWKEHGLTMEFTLAGFVQGTASGGLKRDTILNGKFESKFDIDFEKLRAGSIGRPKPKSSTDLAHPSLAARARSIQSTRT
jgi:hypothetical protein